MDLNKIINEIKYDGFFSDYLPKNFSISAIEEESFDIYRRSPKELSLHSVKPLTFTMPNFSTENNRRIISIPDICSYIKLMEYFEKQENKEVLEKLLERNADQEISFSPNLDDSGELAILELDYPNQFKDKHEETGSNFDESINILEVDELSNYDENIIKKLKKSKGAKGILHIDIANFYGSIYTHFIPSIVLGYEKALDEYKKGNSTDVLYKKLTLLDKKIREINQSRTNGILKGPFISKIIAESLLDTIDNELSNIKIADKKINYTRYMDDYEIYIYDESEKNNILEQFVLILHKYGLTINSQKTKYEEYPFYRYTNFNKMISTYEGKERVDSTDLIDLYNKFYNLEDNGNKGAIRYLVKSLDVNLDLEDQELYVTYLINSLVKDPRTFIPVCKKLKDLDYIMDNIIDDLLYILDKYIKQGKDLEVIWIIYLLINKSKETMFSEIENRLLEIIESNNELSIIMIIHEYSEIFDNNQESKRLLIKKHKENKFSWLMNYELYLLDIIDEDEFKSDEGLKKNIAFYNKLKTNKFSFYNKIDIKVVDSLESILFDQ